MEKDFKRTEADKSRTKFALIMLVPSFLIVLFFTYFMAGQSFFYSLFRYSFAEPPGTFIGFKNYITTFKDPIFWRDIKNTIILWALGIAFGFLVPVIQALLLNEIRGKKRAVMRYLYVLPAAIPGMASLAIWTYIWNVDSGLANAIVNFFGIKSQAWLMDEDLIKICLCIPGILGGGFSVLIYLISIEGISPEIYEAAQVDGASRWKMLTKITLPNMSYMIKIQFLLSLSSSLLAFDNVYVMTEHTGGPNYSAETIVFMIYNKAYRSTGTYGQAMAISVILLVFTLILIGIRKLFERRSSDE